MAWLAFAALLLVVKEESSHTPCYRSSVEQVRAIDTPLSSFRWEHFWNAVQIRSRSTGNVTVVCAITWRRPPSRSWKTLRARRTCALAISTTLTAEGEPLDPPWWLSGSLVQHVTGLLVGRPHSQEDTVQYSGTDVPQPFRTQTSWLRRGLLRVLHPAELGPAMDPVHGWECDLDIVIRRLVTCRRAKLVYQAAHCNLVSTIAHIGRDLLRVTPAVIASMAVLTNASHRDNWKVAVRLEVDSKARVRVKTLGHDDGDPRRARWRASRG